VNAVVYKIWFWLFCPDPYVLMPTEVQIKPRAVFWLAGQCYVERVRTFLR